MSVSLTTEGRCVRSSCCVSRGENPVITASVRGTGRAESRCVCVRRATEVLAATGGTRLLVSSH